MNEETGHLPRAAYFWMLAWCLIATAITAACFLAWQNADVWGGFQPARAFKSPGASERIFVASIFRTRANSWSNLTYVYVGIAAIVASAYDLRRRARGNYLIENPWTGIFFGASCVYLGIGSGVFHASLTHWGQRLDVASMYSALVALIAICLGRWWPRLGALGVSWPWWLALATVVDVLLYIYKWSLSSIVVLPALILTVLAFGIADRFTTRWRLQARWLWGGAITLFLAVACRGLDLVPPLSSPEIWLKGHALWHCFTAASLGCMYVYYRTERPLPRT